MFDEGEGGAPDLRDYGRTLWRRRWLIVLPVLIAIALSLASSATQDPLYEATTQLIIQPSTVSQILASTAENAQNAQRNVDTEVAVLKSRVVRDAAEKALGHAPEVTISSSPTSDVVSVHARSTSPRQAATDADGYASSYVEYRRKQTIDDLLQAGEQITDKLEIVTTNEQRAFLRQQLDQLQVAANLNGVGGARLLAEAEIPTGPVAPRPLRTATVAAVLGLLVGVGIAFLRDHLDDTITSRSDLEDAAEGVSVLGQIPRVEGWRQKLDPYLVTMDAPTSPGAEAFRTLRTSMQFLGVDRELRRIQVTSSNVNEGKSSTVANLAVAFARAGQRVTIICCDLRRPRVHQFFGLSNEVGFTSLLLGQCSLQEALQQVPGEDNLVVLAAGPPAPNPSELLSTSKARAVIASRVIAADIVLIDSPPVLPVSDALIVSGLVDATLLVASANQSSRRGVHRSVELLRQVDAPLVGSVLNMLRTSDVGGADGMYGYAERPDDPKRRSRRDARRERKRSALVAP